MVVPAPGPLPVFFRIFHDRGKSLLSMSSLRPLKADRAATATAKEKEKTEGRTRQTGELEEAVTR